MPDVDRDRFTNSTVFDGFCHRSFDENLDGWRRTQIQPGDFPVIELAYQVIDMAKEINRLREDNWRLAKELAMYTNRSTLT